MKNRSILGFLSAVMFSSALVAASAHAQDISINPEGPADAFKGPSYSPYAGRNFPTRLLWGDTHLHTNLSLDARAGGVLLSPEDAYRFARGEEVISSGGIRVKLSRALDFLVVTDHSDAMGAMNEIVAGNPSLMTDPTVRKWHEGIAKGGKVALKTAFEVVEIFGQGKTPKVLLDKKFAIGIWGDYLKAAESYNDPGRFSAIIGYEWTSMPDGGNNLHRNVIYRGGADQARQMLPYKVIDSDNPEDLWKWLGRFETKTGGQVLAIAHNGNVSNGIMFPDINPETNAPITAAYAAERNRWEPLYEATQIKGDGEAHPKLSPNDEFADYETWDRGNLGPTAKEPWMLQFEYAREALKSGLRHEANLGTNPFKFGMIGSTDAHTGLATAEEDNFFGKHAQTEPKPDRWKENVVHFGDISVPGWAQASSGYAAVWATENSREAIFDAMQRRETYATTGPRMSVRLFGGWDFTSEDANTRLPANVGYFKGVPMGGDLTKAPAGKAPSFLVAARKDPMSGNLDRIQIIKGWLDSAGKSHENVYDVAWSDDRKPGARGKLPAVGNTVDVANATWTNTIGTPELITVWRDPDFDPEQRAFYYARVIEIPTPRWTAYEAKYFKLKMDKSVPMITQERAYTSPIWYTP
jgi:hypothetical protein